MDTENRDAIPATTEAELTRTCQQDSLTSTVVTALEDTWAAIRELHSEVPNAVIVVASGTNSRLPGWSHYAAPMRWQHGDDRLPEVLVSGEGLKRPATDVLTTVLHEATHALADIRGIQDTSRQGRWHNRRFAALADELGMNTTKDPRVGWSLCQLRDTKAARYCGVLDDLSTALAMYRHAELAGTGRRNSNNPISCTCGCPPRIGVAPALLELGPISCTCGCPPRIGVAPALLELGPITCGVCGNEFERNQ
jgi:hypothetical protein